MELPDDVISIVREFARPITRADWRNLRPMPSRWFHLAILDTYYHFNLPVIESYITRYDQIEYSYIPRSTYQPIYVLRLNVNK